LPKDRAGRITSPWAVAGIVAAFYALLLTPGLVQNPYQFVNIGHQYFNKGSSSAVIRQHARPLHGSDRAARIGYDGQFYYFLAVDPAHGKDYMDAPGVIYSRIGYPITARALSLGNATVIPYMMVLINILAAVGGTLAVAFFLKRHNLPPALALLYGFYPGLVLSVLRDLTEPLAFGLAAAALVIFDVRSKRRLFASAALFGLAMLTRETVALFPAILSLALLVGAGTASNWRDRFRPANLIRAVAFAELAFAPLFLWRRSVTIMIPHESTQEAFTGTAHHAGTWAATLVPFHALGGQWPWTGEDVTDLLTVVVPALVWAGIAVALLRRKTSIGPWLVLANVAIFVVFLPTPIAVDYGSLGRASIGVLLASLFTLPQASSTFGEKAPLVRSTFALWSLPFWLILGILLNALGPRFVW
jgi:hypothetical protein